MNRRSDRAASGREAPRASQSLLTGAGLLAAGRYVVAVLGWAGTALIARSLSLRSFGFFTTVFSLLGLVGLLSELRMSRLVLTAILDADDDEVGRVVGSYVTLRIAIGVLGYAAAVVAAVALGYPAPVVRGVALAGLTLVVMSSWYALTLLFQARMWHRTVALSQVVGQAVQLVATITIAALGVGTAVWFTLPNVVNAAVSLVWLVAALRGVLHLRLELDPATWWAWLREAAPLSLGYALEQVYFRIDVLMLSLMSTFGAVGLYGVGYKFADLVGALPSALLAPVLTLMVRHSGESADQRRLHSTFRTALVTLFVVGAGLAVAFAAFSRDLTSLLYGSRYASGHHAARLLVTGQVMHFFSSLCFTTLVAVGRNRLYPLAALGGVLVNVGLNLALIPRYAYEGSAVATIVTETVVLAILAAGVLRIPGVRPVPWATLARISAAAALLAAGLVAGRRVMPWAVAAAAAVPAYLLMLHVLRFDGPGGLRALARAARIEPPALPEPPRVSGGSDDGPPPGPRRPRHLVAVAHTAIVSGAETVLLRVLDAARAAGWEVTCVCPAGALAERVRALGAEHVGVPDLALPAGPRPLGLARLLVRNLRAARSLRRAGRDADVVLVNGLNALVAARAARLRAPVAWLVHDIVVRRDRLLLVRLAAPAVTLAIAVSEAAALPLRRRGLRAVVVRNGTAWPVAPARPADGPPIIGCNAVLTPWKGQDVLLEAVARMPRSDVVVELLGATLPKDGAYAEALRDRAARPDLAGRVRFVGHADDPLTVMRRWSIAACPSVDPEAVSLGVLESMSLGVPVVATDHGGIPEFLGAAGLLVRANHPDDLARALTRVLDDAPLRSRCQDAGPLAVAQGLTVEHQQEQMLAALDDLADHPSRRSGTIVYVVPDYEPTLGGTTRQTKNQARLLLARGHDVVVLTQRIDPRWPRTELIAGLPVRRLRPSGRRPWQMKILVVSAAFWLWRRRRRIAVVHVVMYPDFVLSAALAGLGRRTVVSWAGLGDATDALPPRAGPLVSALRALRFRALSRATHVALTPALRRELIELGLGDHATVIPTPVDTARFRPPTTEERDAARMVLGVAEEELAVLYLGHLRALKRVDLLLEAFAELVSGGVRARLFVVGGSRADLDDRTDELRAQALELGIDRQVSFAGSVADVMPYLHAADLLVQPSDREGLPNSILEALACGVPVVAPPSAAGDQVLDDSCGIVPPSNRPTDLAAALRRLAGDPDLRASLGRGARTRSARYTITSVIDRHEHLYDRLDGTTLRWDA